MSYVADFLGPQGFGPYMIEWTDGGMQCERVSRPPELLLVPGFVDIHFHGAFAIDFMSATSADLIALCDKLAAIGYESFLPTTVTATPAEALAALAQLPEHWMIGGFHLEGPFISTDYPGAQPQSRIADIPIGPSDWDPILDDPRLKVVTLAPEKPHALELIARLASRGVRVSMGHSNATYDEARFGFEFGAAHTTHTFNAMRGFHHREAGIAGYAMATDGLLCELIYDRVHVCRESAALLLKAKGPDGVVAVSDSTMATGGVRGATMQMWGLDVELQLDRVTLKGTDTLAGSAITLLNAFQYLLEDFGPEIAIRLCSVNPRRTLGMRGEPQVYVEFDRKGNLMGVRRLAATP